MNITNSFGVGVITVAVLAVGFVLYQQSERHFSESQRWYDVCRKEFVRQMEAGNEQIAANSTPEQIREMGGLPTIEDYEEEYIYSKCYREWHGGQ